MSIAWLGGGLKTTLGSFRRNLPAGALEQILHTKEY